MAGIGIGFRKLLHYSDDGSLERRELDLDHDGRSDHWEFFDHGRRTRVDVDRDFDGTLDLRVEFGPSGTVISAREDSDGDGEPDRPVAPEEALRSVQVDVPEPDPEDDAPLLPPRQPEQSSCVSIPAVADYAEELQARVYREWEVSSPGSVRVRFGIDPAGCARHVEILSATGAVWSSEALRAMERASPFPLPAEGLECVHDLRFVGTFTTGEAD